MFGAISKLFKKSGTAPVSTTPVAPPKAPRNSPLLVQPPSNTEAFQTPTVSRPVSNRSPDSGVLSIPYSSILKLIPSELWGKLAPAGVAGYSLPIARESVLNQLPHGAIKVTFGEVRKGAPSGVFINTPAEDDRMVDLPLSEILAQIHPDSFARRADQSRVDVQDDVPDVFGSNIKGAPLRVMEKREVSNDTSTLRQKTPGQIKATGSHADSTSSLEEIKITSPSRAEVSYHSPIKPTNPITIKHLQKAATIRESKSAHPVLIQPTAQPSAPLPKPPVPNSGNVKASVGRNSLAALPASPLAQGSFMIGLDAIAENWPDSVRQELAQLKIPDGSIALPPIEICEGLKRGRIQYPWRTLRSWIQPLPHYASPSPNDDLVLELPLRTLTPAFLDFIRSNPVNRNTAAADNITEFFRKAEQTSGTGNVVLESMPRPDSPNSRETPTRSGTSVSILKLEPCPPSRAPTIAATSISAGQNSPSESVIKSAAEPTGYSDPSLQNGSLCIPLSLLSSNWPESVLQDISQFNLKSHSVELPVQLIESGLKSGRVEFAWHQLCAWLKPPSKAAQVSINGEVQVQIPLSAIAPLILKLSPGKTGRRKKSVLDSIPDLFDSGKTSPAPPTLEKVGAACPPVVLGDSSDNRDRAEKVTKKSPTNLSELFGEPTKKSWTPNEIVQSSTSLPGVAGALIALQDGLLVASSLPPEMKIEMIAAFVPQIFGRLNQYSKELHLGNASSVGFTVEAGAMQVYNAGIIYFAALGKPGEALPVNELQLIAAELSRHTK